MLIWLEKILVNRKGWLARLAARRQVAARWRSTGRSPLATCHSSPRPRGDGRALGVRHEVRRDRRSSAFSQPAAAAAQERLCCHRHQNNSNRHVFRPPAAEKVFLERARTHSPRTRLSAQTLLIRMGQWPTSRSSDFIFTFKIFDAAGASSID